MRVFIGKIVLFLKAFITEILFRGQVVKMSAFFNLDGTLKKDNWGDDINYWFLKEIAKDPIVSYDWSLITRYSKRSYVMGIGSLLTLVPLNNSIVWGSGVMSSVDKFKGLPKKVCAVRGPLSRKRLLDAGVECPEVYGDPALLLPKYYFPKVKKNYQLGVILHYKDVDNPLMDRFKGMDNVKFINIRNYDHWLDFIDSICECMAVISTSLHGLIISEAYNVPNLWIKLHREDNKDDIKFHDFFLSIGKDRNAFMIDADTSLEYILSQMSDYRRGSIDLEPLLKSCPIRLKENVIIKR